MDPTIEGAILGSPIFGNSQIHTEPQTLNPVSPETLSPSAALSCEAAQALRFWSTVAVVVVVVVVKLRHYPYSPQKGRPNHPNTRLRTCVPARYCFSNSRAYH